MFSMNVFGNFDDEFNARFYVSITVKKQTKYCFAGVYMKLNSGTNIPYLKVVLLLQIIILNGV